MTEFPDAPPPPVAPFQAPRVVVVTPGYSPQAFNSYRWYTLFGLAVPIAIWLGSAWFTSQAQDRAEAAAAAARANAAAQAQAEAERARAEVDAERARAAAAAAATTTPTAHATTKASRPAPTVHK